MMTLARSAGLANYEKDRLASVNECFIVVRPYNATVVKRW